MSRTAVAGAYLKRKRDGDDIDDTSDSDDEARDFESDSNDENKHSDDEEEDIEVGQLTGPGGKSLMPETGQILSVEAEDFMCHKKFTIKFNRNVNFVTGANGSGKSAIVAAIQLCLGASAKTTGRGSSARSFIRDGTKNNHCIVRVTLRNQGQDTYRPDLYGGTITIERKITKKGVSTYKIIAEDGKVISTDHKEIGNFLKVFNIHVDNPVCLLTQEASKQFIQGSEKEKYAFFLKATGLSRAKEELAVTRQKMDDTDASCVIREEKLGAQREHVDRLERELEELKALDKFESQINEYQAKLHWFDVYHLEQEYNAEEQRLADMQKTLIAVERKKAAAEARVTEMGSVQSMAAESEASLAELEDNQKELDGVVRVIGAKEATYRQLEREVKETTMLKGTYTHRMEDCKKEIARLRRLAMSNSEGKELEIRQRMEAVEQEQQAVAAESEDIKEHKKRDQQIRRDIQEDLDALGNELQQLKRDLQHSSGRLREMEQNSGGGAQQRLVNLNRFLPAIMSKIAKTNGFHGRVIGPIGAHVKLTSEAAQTGCAMAVERIIGNKLAHFLVQDSHDLAMLKDLIRSTCYGPDAWAAKAMDVSTCYKSGGITRYNVDPMPEGAVSIMSCLQIDDDDVFNYLVNGSGIDTVVIATDETDCRNKYTTQVSGELKYIHPIRTCVFKNNGMLFKIVRGSTNTETNRTKFKNLLSEDARGAVQAMMIAVNEEKEVIRQKEVQYNAAREPLQEVENRLQQYEVRTKQLFGRLKSLQNDKRDLRAELDAAHEAEQTDTTEYESELDELHQHVVTLDHKITDLTGQMTVIGEELKVLKENRKIVDRRRREIAEKIDEKEKALENFVVERQKLVRIFEGEKLRADKIEREIGAQNTAASEAKHRLDNQEDYARQKSKGLLEIPEQWDGESRIQLSGRELGSKTVIEQKIVSYKQQLEAGKQRVGLVGRDKKSVQAKWIKAKDAYQEEMKGLADTKLIVANIYEDYKLRSTVWGKMLKKSARQVGRKFDEYLQAKGFAGTVEFDHANSELNIIALTDNLDDLTRTTDIRQCSGGERSFLTFCLLLALGSVIETPFQLMDEYDVFMDQKTRTRTLLMLKQHAESAEQSRKQFIVLTPQSVGTIQPSRTCKIQQLHPPARASAHGLQQQTI